MSHKPHSRLVTQTKECPPHHFKEAHSTYSYSTFHPLFASHPNIKIKKIDFPMCSKILKNPLEVETLAMNILIYYLH